jgi:hypothetical protein
MLIVSQTRLMTDELANRVLNVDRLTFSSTKANHQQGTPIGAYIAAMEPNFENRGEFQLHCEDFSICRISRVMAPAIALTLTITALAQDSLRLRTPARHFKDRSLNETGG